MFHSGIEKAEKIDLADKVLHVALLSNIQIWPTSETLSLCGDMKDGSFDISQWKSQ
jgi:hypothetical protein